MTTNARYITATELVNAPTGINWSTIPFSGASTAQQLQEQNNLIARATGWVDQYTNQKLQATSDRTLPLAINGDRCRWLPDGTLAVRLDYFPVVSVTLVEFSFDGVTYTPVVPPWPAIMQSRQQAILVPQSTIAVVGSTSAFNNGWCRATYIDGYANCLTTSNVSIGGATLPVDDRTGIVAGQSLTVYGNNTQEDVVVSDSYVAATGAGNVALSGTLVNAYTAGARVSALPPAVREATIIVASYWARMRGRGAIEVNQSGGGRVSRGGGIRQDDFTTARDLLNDFRRWL